MAVIKAAIAKASVAQRLASATKMVVTASTVSMVAIVTVVPGITKGANAKVPVVRAMTDAAMRMDVKGLIIYVRQEVSDMQRSHSM